MSRLTRIAAPVLALGMLALAVVFLLGDEVAGRRLPLMILAAAALAWFSRPSALPTVAALIPMGAVLDMPFLTEGRGIYATEVVLLCALFWMFARMTLGRGADWSRPTPFVLLYCGFTLFAVIALIAGHGSLLSAHEGLRTLRVLVLACGVLLLFATIGRDDNSRRRAIWLWCRGSVIGLAHIAAGAIVEYVATGGADEPGSFYRNSVGVAVHVAFLAPFALSLALGSSTRLWRLIAAGAWLAAVICLPLTASRGAIGSVLITSALVGSITLRRRGKGQWRALALVAAFMALGLATLIAKPDLAGEAFAYKFRATVEGDFISTRVDAWNEAGRAIADHPLLGEHPGSESKSIPMEIARRHGLPAALCFLGAIVLAAWGAGRRRFSTGLEEGSLQLASVGLGVAAGLAGLFLVGLAETGIGARTTPLLSATIAVAALLMREPETRDD